MSFGQVSFQRGQLVPLAYESVATKIDKVKFEDEEGRLVVSDIRVVWYKTKKGRSVLKGVAAAIAVGVGGAVVGRAARHHGGVVGDIVGRGVERGTGVAAGAIMFDTITKHHMVKRGEDGTAETMAIPLRAISNATVHKDKLIITLSSGDDIDFEGKRKGKMFSVAVAQLMTAKDANKCPYCGAKPQPGASECSRCGAAVEGGTGPTQAAAPTGMPTGMPAGMPMMTGMPTFQCPFCKAKIMPGEHCVSCGRRLLARCSKCEADIPLFMYAGAKRCPQCGGVLEYPIES
jgi:DNA-directed RNA polymerase subunit RPC12/RpoP